MDGFLRSGYFSESLTVLALLEMMMFNFFAKVPETGKALVCPNCARMVYRARRVRWRDVLARAFGRYPYRCRACNP